MNKGKNVLTTGEVAKICNVAPRTVSKWFDTGQLKGYRIPGSKDRRIPATELMRFMKVHNMPLTELSLTKIRVLLAQSDTKQAEVMTSQLKQAGYEIKTADNEFKLGSLIQQFSPHVIIVSTNSTGINAQQTCKNLRSDENFQTIKLIAAIDDFNEQKQREFLQIGYDDCISSDAEIETVIHKIEEQTAIIYWKIATFISSTEN